MKIKESEMAQILKRSNAFKKKLNRQIDKFEAENPEIKFHGRVKDEKGNKTVQMSIEINRGRMRVSRPRKNKTEVVKIKSDADFDFG